MIHPIYAPLARAALRDPAVVREEPGARRPRRLRPGAEAEASLEASLRGLFKGKGGDGR